LKTSASIQNKITSDNSPSVDGGSAVSPLYWHIGEQRSKWVWLQQDKILSVTSIDSESSNGLTDKLPAIERAVNTMLQQNNIQPNDIAGVGISMPGIVDSIQKKVLSIENKFNDVVI
jgi:glucokinase